MRIPKRKLNVVKWGIICSAYHGGPYFVSGNNDAPLLFETRQDARRYKRERCYCTDQRRLTITRVSIREFNWRR